MVTRATFGCSGQCASRCWSTRAVVDLPTATEPARPMTNGVRGGVAWWRNSSWSRCRRPAVSTYRLKSRLIGRKTSRTSSRSSASPRPRSAVSSSSVSGSSTSLASAAQAARSSSMYGGCLAGLVTAVVVPAVGHGEDSVSHRASSVADPGVDRLAAHVRDRRVRRGQTGPGRRTRRAAAAGVPRLRLRRDRRRGRRQAGGLEEGRQAREPREGHRRPAAARVDHRRRAHPLGHPRRAERRQRPPARRVRPAGSRWCTTGSSRTSPSCGPGSRPTRPARPGLRDRHRGRRPAAGAAARSRTST